MYVARCTVCETACFAACNKVTVVVKGDLLAPCAVSRTCPRTVCPARRRCTPFAKQSGGVQQRVLDFRPSNALHNICYYLSRAPNHLLTTNTLSRWHADARPCHLSSACLLAMSAPSHHALTHF